MHARSASRARVLHVPAPEQARPWINLPELVLILSLLPRHAKSPDRPWLLQRRRSKLLGGTLAAMSATTMDNIAQTTTARQLASFDSVVVIVSP